MFVKVTKRPKENTQSIIRRFTKAVKRSGILIEARKSQFRSPNKNKRAQKISALRKLIMSKKYEDRISRYENRKRY